MLKFHKTSQFKEREFIEGEHSNEFLAIRFKLVFGFLKAHVLNFIEQLVEHHLGFLAFDHVEHRVPILILLGGDVAFHDGAIARHGFEGSLGFKRNAVAFRGHHGRIGAVFKARVGLLKRMPIAIVPVRPAFFL